MAINFNTGPYFDDFDPENQFYKILYKPGYAVQARELNQMQSIAQHQISTFAGHVFKKNSIVIPGGIALNTAVDMIYIVGVNDPTTLIGQTITNATSFDPTDDSTLDGFITAVVLGAQAATSSEPAALYIKYFKSQSDRGSFTFNETLYTVGESLIEFRVFDSSSALRVGKAATLSKGVFFTKNLFVDVPAQSIIIETDNDAVTNCIVGLNIVESIVTSDDDPTLLDNANGAPNQYAPGADRYKVDLQLTKLDVNASINDDTFITLMKIENNNITYINNTTQYAELMKTLARRTYDANGNFIVTGLDTSVNSASDDDYIWINVGKGRCYVGGYEYNQINDTPIAIDKPRSTAYQEIVPTVSEFSSGLTYFYIAGGTYVKELPEPDSVVHFINAAPGTGGTSVIGCGIFKDVQYYAGDPGVDDIYKMFFNCITMEKGYSFDDVGGVIVISSGQGAPVLHELRLSNVLGTFAEGATIASGTNATQTGLIYRSANNIVHVIKNTLNDVPNTQTVKVTAAGSSATLTTTFITNYLDTQYPLIAVDTDVIKTLYNENTNTNETSYSVVRRDIFNVTEAGTITVTLSGTDVFDAYSTTAYYAFIATSGAEAVLDLSGIISIASDRKSYNLVIASGSPLIGDTIWVYSTVIKQGAVQAAIGNPIATTINIATPSASWMALGHQDVLRIVKVVDSGDPAVAADINSEVGVITNRYILDSGRTPYLCGTGMIKLRRKAIPPVGQIAVRYEYHAVGSGNYVSVDSYGAYAGDLSYIGNIPDIPVGDGSFIEARRYIDFRPRTSVYFFRNIGTVVLGSNQVTLRDLNLSHLSSSLVGKYVIGPGYLSGATVVSVGLNGSGNTVLTLSANSTSTATGSFFVGLYTSGLSLVDTTIAGKGKSFNFPKEGEAISYRYTKFKPKQVMVYVDRRDDLLSIKYDEVASIDEAYAIRRNEFKLPLTYLYMEPYTVSINNVQVTKFENPVYQMPDIHTLKQRIDRNEYYTSLALNRDLEQEILDAATESQTITNRGFWNEDFTDVLSQDFGDDDYQCTLYDRSYVAPSTITRTVTLAIDTEYAATTWKRSGSIITLPYTEMRLFGCDVASQSNNLNPFNVINWSAGKMTLIPSVDNWIDVTSEPTIQVAKQSLLTTPQNIPAIPPLIPTEPVLVLPPPPVVEVITEINNLKVSWGPDSAGGRHAITFDWKTNLGRTGRVNTDMHLSPAIKARGASGYNGTYARSLINRPYNDTDVKQYLMAGTHFDQRPPRNW